MRTTFAVHAGGDSMRGYALRNPADGIEVQSKNPSHLHACRQLGIHQLGHHQPPSGTVVLCPLEQGHGAQKDGVTAILRIPQQAEPATEQDARRRWLAQPRLLIERQSGG